MLAPGKTEVEDGNNDQEALQKEAAFNSNVTPAIDVLTTWSQGTSVHGILYALDRENFLRWKRYLWCAIIATFTGIMVYLVVVLVDEYLDYSTETTAYFSAPDSLPFPQVTVCNVNLFQMSRLEFMDIIFPQNDEELFGASQEFGEFFLSGTKTTFNRQPVIPEDVWKPVITPFGLCWQFTTNKRVYNPGNGGGLSFTLNLQQEEYHPSTELAGALVFIEEPASIITDQIPFVWVKPGNNNAILLRATEYKRERDAPWSTCRLRAPEYTQPRCRAECRYEYVALKCGCRSLGDNRPHVLDLDYCNPLASICSGDIDASDYLSDCNCFKPPCHEVHFTPQVHTLEFAENFLQTSEELKNISNVEVRQNVAKVRINYDIILNETVEETKTQTLAGLFADIGGQFGLWAGISFISIIEVIGELGFLRMVPRLWGDRRMYGIGSKEKTD